MLGVSRNYINLDWNKMKEVYPKASINCMRSKWDLFRDDWSQGFDSDCFAHCSNYDNCTSAFYDESLELEDHFKEVFILIDRNSYVDEREYAIEKK